jgi:hypothetical protein
VKMTAALLGDGTVRELFNPEERVQGIATAVAVVSRSRSSVPRTLASAPADEGRRVPRRANTAQPSATPHQSLQTLVALAESVNSCATFPSVPP